eukprot:CAMPEP_0198198456 /NCGR_PEP_ID=MMETSP1445-20131203/1927_1 /TAXON_ID=36898 /ORGANISM="Pyramimonas sp., Strain CCMP2087" /LENGTH=59 /DNA_ID=CAMNT_0043868027 /DNA_START=119 /DNA_END=298 /DNA_ORIENTATION=+
MASASSLLPLVWSASLSSSTWRLNHPTTHIRLWVVASTSCETVALLKTTKVPARGDTSM